MTRTGYIRRDDDDVRFALDQQSTIIHPSIHLDTLFWFRTNQPLCA